MAKNVIIAILVIAVLAVIGYAIAVADRPVSTPPPNGGDPNPPPGEQQVFNGIYVCLPHLDTSGPQTLECALGLQTAGNINYALNTSALAPGTFTEFNTGEELEVMGKLTPRAQIAAGDRLLIYNIVGVIEVVAVGPVGSLGPALHTVAGGDLTFERPADFGLAVSADQVPNYAAVPPCSTSFDYCLYYNVPTYANTNFESAGLRIERRAELISETACLTTRPAGYANLAPQTREEDEYAVSVFDPLQSAATGQSAVGTLYRLVFNNQCWELETRLGVSNLQNFPAGARTEFTPADRQTVEGRLNNLLFNIRFTDDPDEVILP
jgi:hypothetical protein